MSVHFSARQVQFTDALTSVTITVVTDVPCHLWCRLTTEPPQIHTKSVTRRGEPFMSELRFCFVSYEDNEQIEEGDTITHSWVKPDWPYCVTKWCYFWGYVGGVLSKSTTCFFEHHNSYVVSTYTLIISSTDGGDVTEPGEGSFEYDPGSHVDLVASSDYNYHFTEWTGDIENIDDPLAANTFITMNAPATIKANFEIQHVWLGYMATLPTGATYNNRVYIHTDIPANGRARLIYLNMRVSGKPQNNITYAAIVRQVGADTYHVYQAQAFSTPGVGVFRFVIDWVCEEGDLLAFWQYYGSMRREYSLNHNKMSGYIYTNPLIVGEDVYCPYDGESDKLRIYADNWTTF